MSARGLLLDAGYRLRGLPVMRTWREYEDRQWWPVERLRRFTRQRLANVLEHAVTQVPHYRGLACSSDIDAFPVLGRQRVARCMNELTAASKRNRRCTVHETSGSTGEVVHVLADHREHCHRLACTWRGDCFGGYHPWDSVVALWRRPRRTDPWWPILQPLADLLKNRQMVDCLMLDSKRVRRIRALLVRRKPRIILGFSSALASYARLADATGLGPISCGKVIPAADQLCPAAEVLVRRSFDGDVMQRYGCYEVGPIAHQCERGNWHLHSDHVYAEVQREDGTISTTGRGRLLVTALNNYVMPLIRYDIGDVVELGNGSCPCGRSLPIMNSLEGRALDLLRRPDGALVSVAAIGRALERAPVLESQFVQESLHYCRFLVVPGKGFAERHRREMLHEFNRVFDDQLEVTIELVEEIPLAASGKRLPVISLPDPILQ